VSKKSMGSALGTTGPSLSSWAVCKCFFQKNLYVKRWNKHVVYLSDQQFLSENRHRPLLAETLKDVKEEVERRRRTKFELDTRKGTIRQMYTSPLHPEVYKFSKTHLDPRCHSLENLGAEQIGHEVFRIPFFTQNFCNMLLEEVKHFQAQGIPYDKPNSMNRHGIVLDELLDMSEMLSELREGYLQPLARSLFPQHSDIILDSHRAFLVKYKIGEDVDLGLHFDNSEVTLSVALSPDSDFEGGELLFSTSAMADGSQSKPEFEYDHRQGYGVFHLGSKLHQALPIDAGERWSLVFWMRSSQIRALQCPMCKQTPSLEPAPGFGDGFKML